MSIEFKKLKVGKRFSNTFECWTTNNELKFENKNFISVYAPNGVGKSSLAKALKNEITSSYEYEYDGILYSEKSKETPFMIIDDFFFRNIAIRENEKLSDYILGTEIAKELELKEKIIKARENIRNNIIEYLKDVYGIKTKSSKLSEFSQDVNFKKFINAIANSRDKGKKDYNEKEFIELLSQFKIEKEIQSDISKYIYVRENLEKEKSIIKEIITFDINAINGFSRLDIDNDALKILKKHKDIEKCIFDESHLLSQDIKIKLEENKNFIINQLTKKQKELVFKILDSDEVEPFNIKQIFSNVFEFGETEQIENLIKEIKLIILQMENTIKQQIIKIINDNELKKIYDEYMTLISKKVELSEDDELLLKEIIENCINKPVMLDRDENKNIIFTLGDSELIGKSRQELPLSTGEQNFISLYFELLSAKNNNKQVIIIDDPVSSFDSIYKNKIIYAILKVLSGKKVIVLTHNINTIKLMQHQYKDCFNLYLLNNQDTGENGFIKIERKVNDTDLPKDLDLILEIKNVLEILRKIDFINDIKNKKQFLISLIPFMRSYTNLLNNVQNDYKELSKLMHGYENEKININEKYKNIFGIDVLGVSYEIDVKDILNISIDTEIVNMNKYPLLNRTLKHILTYLKLRLLVEETLYKTDVSKIRVERQPKLHQIIEIYLKNSPIIKSKFLSKKTLLNEFNHFEFDMCLFMPSLDISDYKLAEEEKSIIDICNEIRKKGL